MITKVVKFSWTDRNGNYGFNYRVHHNSKSLWRKDRVYTYSWNQNLPKTVLDYVLNANNCETVYVPEKDHSPGIRSLKKETYTM